MNNLKGKENALAKSILELGSVLVGKELTMDDAYRRFRGIDVKKEVLCHNSEHGGYIHCGKRLVKK